MKIISQAIIILSVLFISTHNSAQTYQLVWEDNFDGNSLDSNIWNVEERVGTWNTGQNDELQHYKTENVSVGDDGNGNNCLIISAIKEPYGGYSFTSGRINTNSKLSFKYGKLEARIKIPNLKNGLWPAFWTLGYTPVSWPASGEIDIMEMGLKEGIAQDTVNSYATSATHWEYNDTRADYGTHYIASSNLSDDYHTYSVIWTSTSIKTYLDDTQLIYNFSLSGSDLEEFKSYSHYILLNLAVGGILPNITNIDDITAPLPANMYVDYVKLYQLEGQEDVTIGPHPLSGTFGAYVDGDIRIYMNPEFDSEIVTSGLSSYSGTPYEGQQSLAYNTSASSDFSIAVNSLTNRNLTNFSEGALEFVIKTNNTSDLTISIADSIGQTATAVISDANSYDLKRDNNWRSVQIPIGDFNGEVDLSKLTTLFSISGTGSDATSIELDNIIWVETYVRKNLSHYGIFSEHQDIDEKLNFATSANEGQLNIWNGFTNNTGATPFYGDGVISFRPNTGTWNGFGIQSQKPIVLSDFIDGNLHFRLKTTSTEEFKFGFSNQDNQEYELTFTQGNDPYNFTRNGEWNELSIPLTDFIPIKGAPVLTANTLDNITTLFYLVGTINFSLDEMYLSDDGTALDFNTNGISDNSVFDDVQLYPIPARSTVYIFNVEAGADVMIYSTEGRLIDRTISTESGELNISKYKSGVYILRISSKKGIFNKRLIVQ